MITVEEHLARVLDAAPVLSPESVAVADAGGRTLASPVLSRLDIPAFDNSAMDGFAVRFADVSGASPEAPIALRVVGDVPAGSSANPPLGEGDAVRIMTGAPVPSGADTIVPFEATIGGLGDSTTQAVVRLAPRAIGAHIRRRAEDLSAADTVLEAGTLLGPFHLAAAAASGAGSLRVTRRPRLLVASTGSELVSPGTIPGPGQIPDSNGTLIAQLAEQAGADVSRVTHVGDDPAELIRLIEDSSEADVIITSGGVSAGAYEPVKLALADQIDFVTVAMQPGKPQAFGVLPSGALFFGLPGNPVSVAVSFENFVRPALLTMQGRSTIHRPKLRLPAAEAWRAPTGRRQYIPIVVDKTGAWTVRPASAGGSGSHLVGGLGKAEGYAVVPTDVDGVTAGDMVDVLLMM
ncbi:gephyrin-like molybdotransferase Glp [Microbacterium amylolyticum]|uniref:Molybdopterin molybdenumtransferase n=1 Tax=Microbacterium amylolyticum TaxID=936337 RepID=A0ABS4ZET3_9MICO|nr:gephyrin-like molybdotransferase Glp [Microbacterium amylolyticum]MBP2435784.1 molybdopterin molybdotransferase [Microbacterium amylolyticum]